MKPLEYFGRMFAKAEKADSKVQPPNDGSLVESLVEMVERVSTQKEKQCQQRKS